MSIVDEQKKYERWWLGKKCRLTMTRAPFKVVTKIILHGPPSFVYGFVELFFDDGTSKTINTEKFKPGKRCVEVFEG